MSRHSSEVIAFVDELVAQLDADTIDEPYTPPATSSFAIMVAAWERFKCFIDALDVAVTHPFGEDSADVLKRAEELTSGAAFRIAFWLAHVGEAIARRQTALPPPS